MSRSTSSFLKSLTLALGFAPSLTFSFSSPLSLATEWPATVQPRPVLKDTVKTVDGRDVSRSRLRKKNKRQKTGLDEEAIPTYSSREGPSSESEGDRRTTDTIARSPSPPRLIHSPQSIDEVKDEGASKRKRLDSGDEDEEDAEVVQDHRPASSSVPSVDQGSPAPWLSGCDFSCYNSLGECLNEEMRLAGAHIGLTQAISNVRHFTFFHIAATIEAVIPDAVVERFGSSTTGFALPMSNIDIVVMAQSLEGNDNTRSAMELLADAFEQIGITSQSTFAHGGGIPILTFVTTRAFLRVNICINDDTWRASSTFINNYLSHSSSSVSSVMRNMILVLKLYLQQRGYSEVCEGGLSSHAVVLMIIHYFETHPYGRLDDVESHAFVLLAGFFAYFGTDLSCDNIGISFKDGERFFDKRWQKLGFLSPISIKDPLIHGYNTSYGCTRFTEIRRAFAETSRDLHSGAVSKANLFQSMKQRASTQDVEELSLLSNLFTIDPEMVNDRDRLERAWRELEEKHPAGPDVVQ